MCSVNNGFMLEEKISRFGKFDEEMYGLIKVVLGGLHFFMRKNYRF